MVAHILTGHRAIGRGLLARQAEIARHERREVEAVAQALLAVAPEDRRRCVVGHGVGEGLAVLEHPLQLHVHEQLPVELQRRLGLRRRRQGDQPEAEAEGERSSGHR